MPDFDHSVLGTPRAPVVRAGHLRRLAPLDGAPGTHAEAIRQVVAEAVLADRVGVDYFGIGEHHRDDFAVSAPDVVLAAIAGQTERIRLGTGVTVLSSDDPVRVFERFATLDARLRRPRRGAAGPGSFTESFPLFGSRSRTTRCSSPRSSTCSPLLQDEKPVTWEGTHPSAARRPVRSSRRPRPAGCPPGSGSAARPESVVRAARTACRWCWP